MSGIVSQEVVETIIQPGRNAQVSQDAVEGVIRPANPNGLASQFVLEAITSIFNFSNARVSQYVIEVVATNPTPSTLGRVYGPALQCV